MNVSVRTLASHEVGDFVNHLLQLVGHDPDLIQKEIRFIQWWFFSRDQDQNVLAAAFAADGEPAGYVGYSRTELSRGKTSIPAGILSSAMTNPRLRGQGVFSSLVRHLIEQAAQADVDVLYGSPNSTSCRIFISRLGFKGLFHWHRSGRPVRWGSLGTRFGSSGKLFARIAGRLFDAAIPLRIAGFNYTIESELPDDFSAFISEATQQADCHLARTPEYCRWRFSRPDREYRHVVLRNRDNKIEGWALINQLEHGNRSRFHIGDYWVVGKDPRTTRALMAALSKEAAKVSVDDIYVAGRTCSKVHDLRRFGFIRKKSQTPIVALSPTGRDLSLVNGWEFRDIDADMF